ncbi:MAG: EAL domain-containing protein [Candidatus Dormibacteraeota bacterium]|nr:EAL domain-containing protein [Candidatus Dormibacteraeota bacterium]
MEPQDPAPSTAGLAEADERSTPRNVLLVGGSAPFASIIEAVIREGSGGRTRFTHVLTPEEVRPRDIAGACVLVHLGRRASGLTLLERVMSVASQASIVAVTESEDDDRGLLALQRGAHEHISAQGCTTAQLLRAAHSAHERRRSALEREAADAFAAENASLVRDMVDSLEMMAIAIDGDGTIFQANRAWHDRPALKLSDRRLDIGENYLWRCEQLAREGSPDLAAVAKGIRSVLARTAARFELEFQLAAGPELRTVRVIALPLLGRPGAVVSHTNVVSLRAAGRDDTEGLAAAEIHAPRIAATPSALTREPVDLTQDMGALRTEIERAIAAKELSLAFQPIVALDTGRILGAEALLRWRRLGGHWVNPAEVVVAAEESGLIGRIGRWVLETACTRLAELEDRLGVKRKLGISINLSGSQLADPWLPDDVVSALRRSGCDPSAVCLEVTETAIADDLVASAANLDVLRRLGVSVALDDFGTGYSSLQYAKHFRVNIVKIDKIFVQELGRGGPDRVIVASVVALAHGLGALVIAEGVETEEQRRLLAALDCDGVQGHLMSAPLEFDEFVALCESERRWRESQSVGA